MIALSRPVLGFQVQLVRVNHIVRTILTELLLFDMITDLIIKTISIQNNGHEYDWCHINTKVDDTIHAAEQTCHLNSMVGQSRSSHIKKTYNPLTYSPLQTVLSLTNNWPQ